MSTEGGAYSPAGNGGRGVGKPCEGFDSLLSGKVFDPTLILYSVSDVVRVRVSSDSGCDLEIFGELRLSPFSKTRFPFLFASSFSGIPAFPVLGLFSLFTRLSLPVSVCRARAFEQNDTLRRRPVSDSTNSLRSCTAVQYVHHPTRLSCPSIATP